MSYHISTFFPSIATSGSKNSTAVGSPAAKISRSTRRPKAKPLAMSSEPVRVGSLIRPRQPTAVRGFSKYVLRCFMEGNWVFAGHVLGGSWRWITSWLTVWSKKPIGVQPKGVQSWPPIWLNEIFNSDGGIGAAGLLLLWNLATSRLSSANWLIHKVMWYTLDMEKNSQEETQQKHTKTLSISCTYIVAIVSPKHQNTDRWKYLRKKYLRITSYSYFGPRLRHAQLFPWISSNVGYYEMTLCLVMFLLQFLLLNHYDPQGGMDELPHEDQQVIFHLLA